LFAGGVAGPDAGGGAILRAQVVVRSEGAEATRQAASNEAGDPFRDSAALEVFALKLENLIRSVE
jgi:hypothetical protein